MFDLYWILLSIWLLRKCWNIRTRKMKKVKDQSTYPSWEIFYLCKTLHVLFLKKILNTFYMSNICVHFICFALLSICSSHCSNGINYYLNIPTNYFFFIFKNNTICSNDSYFSNDIKLYLKRMCIMNNMIFFR